MRLRRAGSIVLLFWIGLASVVQADDNLIARELADQLRISKANNDLNDFRIGVKVENGVVWMKGSVQDEAQQQQALKLARTIEGVKLVVNDLKVGAAADSARKPLPAQSPKPAAPRETAATPMVAAPPLDLVPVQHVTPPPALAPPTPPEQTVAAPSPPTPAIPADAAGLQPAFTQTAHEGTPSDSTAQQEEPRHPSASNQVATRPPVQQTVSQRPARRVARAYTPPVPVRTHGNVRRAQYASEMVAGGCGVDGCGCGAGGCGAGGYGAGGYGAGGYGAGGYGGNMGAPVPEGGYGGGYAVGDYGGGISYEQPQLPGHAWPSYAAYPNYGAVTYPKQYSPNAWPYIGPFYPYPQVPMGWRKVSLEWDDGWWFLDFKAK